MKSLGAIFDTPCIFTVTQDSLNCHQMFYFKYPFKWQRLLTHILPFLCPQTSFLSPSISWEKHPPAPSLTPQQQETECLSLTPLVTAPPHRHSMLRQYLDAPIKPGDDASEMSSSTSLQSLPSLYPRAPLPVPLEIGGKECSVIQSPSAGSKTTYAATSSQQKPVGRKGSRFRPNWLDSYVWLQYDERLNIMYCKFCRKWSGEMPDIRTSFAEGSSNFRLEIVNHHDKCKAHRLCVAREYRLERSQQSSTSGTSLSSFYNIQTAGSRLREELYYDRGQDSVVELLPHGSGDFIGSKPDGNT